LAQLLTSFPEIIGLLVAGIVLLVAYTFLKPIADILLFLVVGLFASSLARTRSGGLFTAGGMRVGLWALSYVFSQLVSSFLSIFMMPLMIMLANIPWLEEMFTNRPELLFMGGAGITVIVALVTIAAEFALTFLLLSITRNRAEHLSVSPAR
jgi:hypothetical protein